MPVWVGAYLPSSTAFGGYVNVDGSPFNNQLFDVGSPTMSQPPSCLKLPAGKDALMVKDTNCNHHKHFFCVYDEPVHI